MKKLAILFLLTSLIGASAFAIEGVGDFTVGAIFELEDAADSLGAGQSLAITPSLSFSRLIIPGLNISIGLNSYEGATDNDNTILIPFKSGSDVKAQLNKLDEKVAYSLAAGPGTLGFYLRNRNNIPIKPSGQDITGALRFDVNYALPAGPGTIAFGIYTGVAYAPDFDYNDLGFDLGYTFDFGLSIATSTWFRLSSEGDGFDGYDGTWYNIGYTQEAWGAGLEGGIFHDGTDLGLSLKPYFEYYGLVEGLTVGVEVTIGDSKQLIKDDDLDISPGLYVTYKF
jgi:hypothetical protein